MGECLTNSDGAITQNKYSRYYLPKVAFSPAIGDVCHFVWHSKNGAFVVSGGVIIMGGGIIISRFPCISLSLWESYVWEESPSWFDGIIMGGDVIMGGIIVIVVMGGGIVMVGGWEEVYAAFTARTEVGRKVTVSKKG